MDSTFNLEIITPERVFFEGEVEMVALKTPQGEIGILKQHMPMVLVVDVGPIRIKRNGEWMEALLTEGFMEIKQDRTVILTDSADWPDEIDVNKAEKEKKRAEEELTKKLSHMEHIRAKAALAKAIASLKIKNKKI